MTHKTATVTLILILVMSSLLFFIPNTLADIPSGLTAYVPITVTNSQSTAVSAYGQISIQMNWSAYSTYLDNPVDNVYFFNSSWNTLYAWIENGTANTDQNSIVWLKLDQAGIPANSAITIYLGFYALTTNKLSASSYLGENPQATATYGQYDNGANVFTYYTNFTTATGWTTVTGSPTINKGFTFSQTTNVGIYLTATYNPQAYVFDTNATIGTQSNTREKNLGWINGGTYNLGYDWYSNGGKYYVENQNSGGGWSDRAYATSVASGRWGIFSTWANGTGSKFAWGYYPTDYYATSFQSNTALNAWYITQNLRSVSAQWARMRLIMPNDVMPTATFGTLLTVISLTFYSDNANASIYYNGTLLANGTTINSTSLQGFSLSAVIGWNYTLTNWTWNNTVGSSTTNPYVFTSSNTTFIWLHINNLQGYYDTGYSAGWSSGNSSGYTTGYNLGYSQGNATGWLAGNSTGYANGWSAGNLTGYTNGYSSGYEVGYGVGYSDGYAVGWNVGNASGWVSGNLTGYNQGWAIGNNTGYISGYDNGFVAGWASGNASGYNTGYNDGNYTGYFTGWADGNLTGWVSGNNTGWIDGNFTGFTAGYEVGYNDGLLAAPSPSPTIDDGSEIVGPIIAAMCTAIVVGGFFMVFKFRKSSQEG